MANEQTTRWTEAELDAAEIDRVARAIAANLPPNPEWSDFLEAASEAIAALRGGYYTSQDNQHDR
jgi:hypothetical protein